MKYFYISIICIFIGAAGFFLWPVFFPEPQVVWQKAGGEGLMPFEEWQRQALAEEAAEGKEDKVVEPGQKNKVKIVFVGDVMLSRVVGEKMVAKKNYFYPFEKMATVLQKADLTFGNLESPIINGAPVKTGSFSFRADEAVGESLAKAGFDVVSLANNHILNQGQKGIAKTVEVLAKNGIADCGLSGLNKVTEIIEKNGLKFVFLCYSYEGFEPLQNNFGVNSLNVAKMQKDIEQHRKNVDFVIVSMHAGIEYEHLSAKDQQKFARAAVDAGADLVIGHHPHVVQEMEKYKDKLIFYSLGNFIFDQMWSEDTRQGVVVEVTFTKNSAPSADNFFPIYISDYSQPDLAVGRTKEKILSDLGVLKKEQ